MRLESSPRRTGSFLVAALCFLAISLGEHSAVPARAQTGSSGSPSSNKVSPWRLEADAIIATPTSDVFRDGWGTGFGLAGSLRRTFGSRLEVGVEGEFVQFGFSGLEGFGSLGGARRLYGVTVPVHVRLWERLSPGREQFTVIGSGGWGFQQIDGTFDSTDNNDISFLSNGDGWRVAGELRFSRILYRETRWNLGLRFTHTALQGETPQYLSLVLGARMPLSGSRP